MTLTLDLSLPCPHCCQIVKPWIEDAQTALERHTEGLRPTLQVRCPECRTIFTYQTDADQL